MANDKNKHLVSQLALQEAFGKKPIEVSGIENIASAYYFQYLLRLAKGIFEIKAPDYWDTDFILNNLLLYGVFEANSQPTVIEPATMRQTMGVPTMKPLQLSSCTGFCQCANAHVDIPGTSSERDAID